MPKRKADAGGGSEAAPGEEDASQAVLDDVLRVVRDCLVKLRAGDLFTADLDKECHDQLTPATTTDEDGNEKMTKVFKAFLGAVADTLAAETTMDPSNDTKMAKKMRKKWNKLLKEHFEAVEDEVNKELAKAGGGRGQAAATDADGQDQEMADADDAGSTAAAATGKDDEDNDLTSEHEFDDDDDESGAESRGSSKRSKSSKASKSSSKKKSKKAKRKAKKKKREKKKKRKAREMADLDASDADDGGGGSSDLNGMSREEAREMFVRERDEILSQIPKDAKDRFRECGFATWGKAVYPESR